MSEVVSTDLSEYRKIITRRGDDFFLEIRVYNPDGSSYDFTDHTATFDVYTSPAAQTSSLSFSSGSGLTLSNGLITLSKTYTQMNPLRRGAWLHMLRITNPDGTKKLRMNGDFIVNEGTFTGNTTTELMLLSIGTQVIKSAYVSLTSAQILALNSTMVDALAAPGANKYNSPVQLDYMYTFGTITYTRNSSALINLYYDGITVSGLAGVGSLLTQASSSVSNSIGGTSFQNIAQSLIVNKKLQFGLNTGSFTLGNGTLRIRILYQTVDLT